jgi:hypothetical protein
MKSTLLLLSLLALLSGCSITKLEVRYEQYAVAVELDQLQR